MATFHDNSFKAPWGGSSVGLKGVYWRMGTKASSRPATGSHSRRGRSSIQRTRKTRLARMTAGISSPTLLSLGHDSGWSRSEYPTNSNAMIANKLATTSRRRIAFLNFSIAFSLSSCL